MMNRKQKIILNDLERYMHQRIADSANDFIDRCNESDVPHNDIAQAIVHQYLRIAVLVMDRCGFSPEQIAKYAFAYAKELKKREGASSKITDEPG